MIPARGGSKGIPRKNLVSLAGKPLIQYTLEAALESGELEWVVLSTDDEEIAELGRKAGVDVPFLRPSPLATDRTVMVPVIEHAVRWANEKVQGDLEAVMVLQPTSPFRRARHIDGAARRFREADTDGVVSVSAPVEHPYEFVTFSAGEMRRAVERKMEASRRQDWPKFFFVNGAIYLVRTSALMRDHTLLPRRSVPYLMDQRDSVDIDSVFDLKIAECLLSSQAEASGESEGKGD